MPKKYKVLFVCLGNICRSPTAEAVFRKKFSKSEVSLEFDSAGTADYHVGEGSDPRTILFGEARGYALTHRARQIQKEDFSNFDFIFAMDKSNLKNLLQICPKTEAHKVQLLLNNQDVPDPYYGNQKDFELVIDLCEQGARLFEAMLNTLR